MFPGHGFWLPNSSDNQAYAIPAVHDLVSQGIWGLQLLGKPPFSHAFEATIDAGGVQYILIQQRPWWTSQPLYHLLH